MVIRPSKNKPGWYNVAGVLRHADLSSERVRHKNVATSKREAAKWYEDRCVFLREQRRLAAAGLLHARREVPTLKAFSETYMLYVKANTREGTRRCYQGQLEAHLLPHLGSYRLDEVGRHIEAMKAALVGTYKASVINLSLRILRAMLRYAAQDEVGLLVRVPRIQMLKVPKAHPRFLQDDEIERLLTAGRKTEAPIFPAVLFALKTGARPGEVFEFRHTDMDWVTGLGTIARQYTAGRIEPTTKSGSPRAIHLSPATLAELKRHRKVGVELLFTRPDGRRWTHSMAAKALHDLCRRAGLQRTNWKTLRHSFASGLAVRDVSIAKVQKALGHASIATTMIYSHLSPGGVREAFLRLDEPLRQSREKEG